MANSQSQSHFGARRIIHVDMDCFFAAIECRDHPEVAHLPVGVGGSSPRGVLSTCNYVARQYGCRSAMPVFKAKELCPDLIMMSSRFGVYGAEAKRIRALFHELSDLVEPLSLDEAFIDVSHRPEAAWDLAAELRAKIFATTQLTASAGIAPNKMLAKIASDWRKPNGQFAITPAEVPAFMQTLSVRKIPGVGPRAQEKLAEAGITTCGDVQKRARHELVALLGESWASELTVRAQGEDTRPVVSHRIRKSHGHERTFSQNLETLSACEAVLEQMRVTLGRELDEKPGPAPFNKVFVKVKFANFQQTTKEAAGDTLDPALLQGLLAEAWGRSPHAVRLLGVGVRFPVPEEDDGRQLTLFAGG